MARTNDCRPMSFSFESFITGNHIYKDIWRPTLGERLMCEREPENAYDQYSISVIKNDTIVGHIPKRISKPGFYALITGGSITAVVSGERQNTQNNGLEIPADSWPCQRAKRTYSKSTNLHQCIARFVKIFHFRIKCIKYLNFSCSF